MKASIILITTIAAIAASHGQIEDPGVNGRRQLLGRALNLAPRQGDGAGPYVGPSNPGANGRKRQADSAGPYEGPLNPGVGEKKRQENQTPPGSFGGTVPSGGASRMKWRQAEQVRRRGPSLALKNRQVGDLPDPVVAARQAETTGTEG